MSNVKRPGVYVDEIDAFPNSVVPVGTGIPAFIGCTETAEIEGKPLTGHPFRIESLADFKLCFGGAGPGGFSLYDALDLFYANGGSTAFILSIGPFGSVAKADFLEALTTLESEAEPDILLAPDALRLPPDDYHQVARAMIGHCATLGSRMAILDLYGGDRPEAQSAQGFEASLDAFRMQMAPVPEGQRCFGAAYYPWIVTAAGTVPPSAAMAGLWALQDMQGGLWMAPANLGVALADDVALHITDIMQQTMNEPVDGLSVNAIRFFPNMGILVWGARTLEGNSQDFRYIAARRTITWLAQSIKVALQNYAFQPNDKNTWSAVTAMVGAFLTMVWKEGGLQGSTAADAFSVSCGLGTTMTGDDLIGGRLIVSVKVAITHPAEFIVVTLVQQMQTG
jgi:uncharacterized protein